MLTKNALSLKFKNLNINKEKKPIYFCNTPQNIWTNESLPGHTFGFL